MTLKSKMIINSNKRRSVITAGVSIIHDSIVLGIVHQCLVTWAASWAHESLALLLVLFLARD